MGQSGFGPALLLALGWAAAQPVAAQDASWWARWEARVRATQVNQPHWATPLVTTNARIEQGLRADFTRQSLAGGQRQWNDGGGNGLQVVPWARTEIRVSPPPFFSHSDPRVLDGFGDVGFRLKYRVYGSSEQHHNAIVSAMVAGTVPTGKQRNGSCCAVVSPTLDLGKGFGRFAVTTLGTGSLPVSNVTGLGRSVSWNTAAQVVLGRYLWPELETNTTWYFGGRNDGHVQSFVTPGLVVSRLPLLPGHGGGAAQTGPLLLTLGVGEQIAVTHWNTYNHALVLTGRLRF